eukprot:gene21106-biopygen7098
MVVAAVPPADPSLLAAAVAEAGNVQQQAAAAVVEADTVAAEPEQCVTFLRRGRRYIARATIPGRLTPAPLLNCDALAEAEAEAGAAKKHQRRGASWTLGAYTARHGKGTGGGFTELNHFKD